MNVSAFPSNFTLNFCPINVKPILLTCNERVTLWTTQNICYYFLKLCYIDTFLFLRLKLFSLSVRHYIHRSQAVQSGNQIWPLALHFLPTWAECILAISRSSSVIELKWNTALSELDKVLHAARREAKPKCFIATLFLSRILKCQYSFTLLMCLYN